MSVTTTPEGKWKIVTKEGREIVVEAPHITETEARIMSALLDAILNELEKYTVEFEFTVGTQVIKVKAKLKKT
jgi:hypothetical protein